jgi:hypothetical protein
MMFGQSPDTTITLLGNLYSKKTFQPVEFAHVINTKQYRATISDSSGNFKIRIEPGDTVLITAIGYENKQYVYEGEYQEVIFKAIPMAEKLYKIDKVEITPWGTYRDFKNKFISLDVENPRDAIHPRLWKELPEPPEDLSPREPTILNPISLLYYTFSEEGKSLRKLKELEARKPIEDKIDEKYNREIVGNLTGLEGKELERFMKFCNFTEQYLLDKKKYTILKRVKEKYQVYKDSLNIKNETHHVPADTSIQ